MSANDIITRWSILDRISHFMNLLGVLIAIVSGLPQLNLIIFGFDLGGQFRWITDFIGGEGIRRILHRYIVTGLIGSAFTLHVLSFGLRKQKSHIIFTWKDLKDLIAYYEHKFFKKSKPSLGFHVPGEKLLYWIALVCLFLLGLTGIMMWMRSMFIEYNLLRLLHRIAFIILSVFVLLHFILNIVLPEQLTALKAMFIHGKVSREWIKQHHPKTFEEEQVISISRRRTLKLFLWIIPAAGLSYLFSELLQKPQYKIGEIIVEPAKVMAGKPFTIFVEVTNTGYREDAFSIQLFIDGEFVAERKVTLLDGETRLLNFKATLNDKGQHIIEVNGISKLIEVVEAPPPIEKEIAEKFKKLLAEAYDFIPVIKDGKIAYYEIYDDGGMLIAYGFYERVYAPTDRLTVTGIIDLNYKIKMIDIEKLKPDIHVLNEKILEPEFENQFIGLMIEEVKLSPEGKIDAVSGATISSSQIVETIRKVLGEIQSSS
ncbi:MAG: cytochrome b/b6 domain-containing protein [Aigarchaeota archaeon]|nr:cytochrome b/b6 domain-containing protein [Aigarchaeota archaeon]MCX8193448.1 cytochrome b/b6 domain-containing protein [Nitrososphaeria archaeon]MDW7985820.1 cytochrome b/b6 domain-containing protein [Nitrososphaerota archaeon]